MADVRGAEGAALSDLDEPVVLPARLRVFVVREPARARKVAVTDAATVFRLFRQMAESWDREHFLSLALDGKGRAIGYEEVSVGTLTASLVHPREIFKSLFLLNAVSFVLVHNHPSGDPTPSAEDVSLTARLRSVAEIHGIKLVDHVILGDGRYASMMELGQL
ncbi:JAB domain-containing protein [Candidatus Binatia bacterium]|nr:JAB domain-containing protein [Candidatus Binatia bacterium]